MPPITQEEKDRRIQLNGELKVLFVKHQMSSEAFGDLGPRAISRKARRITDKQDRQRALAITKDLHAAIYGGKLITQKDHE